MADEIPDAVRVRLNHLRETVQAGPNGLMPGALDVIRDVVFGWHASDRVALEKVAAIALHALTTEEADRG